MISIRNDIFRCLIQGTTSIAEKTVRPLMSATTVVSATAVVACKGESLHQDIYFQATPSKRVLFHHNCRYLQT